MLFHFKYWPLVAPLPLGSGLSPIVWKLQKNILFFKTNFFLLICLLKASIFQNIRCWHVTSEGIYSAIRTWQPQEASWHRGAAEQRQTLQAPPLSTAALHVPCVHRLLHLENPAYSEHLLYVFKKSNHKVHLFWNLGTPSQRRVGLIWMLGHAYKNFAHLH